MVDMELKLLVWLCGKIPETYALYKNLKFEHFLTHTQHSRHACLVYIIMNQTPLTNKHYNTYTNRLDYITEAEIYAAECSPPSFESAKGGSATHKIILQVSGVTRRTANAQKHVHR